MSRHAFARALVLGATFVVAAPAARAGLHVEATDCGLHSDYAMSVRPDTLVFTRKDGAPSEVVIGHGTLRVDGREVALDARDRDRIIGIEHGVRDVLPEARALLHDAVAIAFDAVTEVAAAFASSGDAARASAQRLARAATDIGREIDAIDDITSWNDGEIDRVVGRAVSAFTSEVVSSVAAQAVSVALSGDQKAIAELEARADGLDAKIDRVVERRSHELEARAGHVCTRLRTLARIEAELEVRPDGQRLDLVRVD